MDDIKLALLGDHEAAKRLTDAGVLVPCPWCGSDDSLAADSYFVESWVRCYACGCDGPIEIGKQAARLAWNTRAPILSAEEMERLEGME